VIAYSLCKATVLQGSFNLLIVLSEAVNAVNRSGKFSLVKMDNHSSPPGCG
jgi:hypothetical protein